MSPFVALVLAFLGIAMILIGATLAKEMVERRRQSPSAGGDTGKERGGFGKDLADE